MYFCRYLILICAALVLVPTVDADDPPAAPQTSTPAAQQPAVADRPAAIPAPAKVDVQPIAEDDQISARLRRILLATGWFRDPAVQVKDGVVFISGVTDDAASKEWASDLARNTQDVAAVVNRIELTKSSMWDLRPALQGTRDIWRQTIGFLPFAVFGGVILFLAWVAARLTARSLRAVLRTRMSANLLADVIARAAAVIVLLMGLYVVLRVSGLTRLALTLLGGTGLFGLVIGIAFRDITENFLSSIFLSLQRPFRAGDLVEINGVQGLVQRLNIRSTVLMTLTGNHVQIPNSIVYKSMLFNFTSNPNRREDFTIAIGIGDSVSAAQQAILKVLEDHPAVLREPEPWVLVENISGGSTNLRVYFWLDGSQHSWLKVRSSIIRLVKNALQDRKMLQAVDNRQSFFPQGLDVRLTRETAIGHAEGKRASAKNGHARANGARPQKESNRVYTAAEADLRSEATQIEEQARQARTPEGGENLLKPAEDSPEQHATDDQPATKSPAS